MVSYKALNTMTVSIRKKQRLYVGIQIDIVIIYVVLNFNKYPITGINIDFSCHNFNK